MKSKNVLIFTLGLSLIVECLNGQDKYYVKFKDKNNSPYSIENPSAFLSERAIDRRTKQNIAITTDDLPVNPSYIQQIKETGVSLDYSLKWFNGVVVTVTNSNQLTSIQNQSFVSSIEKIFQSNKKGFELVVNVGDKISKQKFTHSTLELNYGNSSTQIKMMNGHILHNNGFLGDGIHIAVIDAGFLNVDTHPAFDSLRTRGRILGTKDFINPHSNIYQEHYHGMMVLSTMGGYIDGQLIGTAPHAKYWLIRTENANVEQIYEEYAWAAGAEFADSVGADIINTSLGYTEFDVATQSHTYSDLNGDKTAITKAANIAASKGIAVVVSAGNDGNLSWYYISAPADSPNVLTVGAVDENRVKASFSSFGPTADGRTKPDVCAMGKTSTVAITPGLIGTANGTSFSSPIMAGMLACLWQAKPNLSSKQIMQLVKSSSNLYNTPNNSYGYGIPDFATAASVSQTIGELNTVEVFPNPFTNSFRVKLPNKPDGKGECIIYSMLGDEILRETNRVTNNNIEITVPSRIPKGNYIIKIRLGEKTYFGKGVKN